APRGVIGAGDRDELLEDPADMAGGLAPLCGGVAVRLATDGPWGFTLPLGHGGALGLLVGPPERTELGEGEIGREPAAAVPYDVVASNAAGVADDRDRAARGEAGPDGPVGVTESAAESAFGAW